ncbi:unnamed protein product [Meganyctiphanes norvegica]|uniref:G-protein coupled receptors family 1 profile domain-containing protein n=1 Tax=Meganyctiphanes norvegica TaxID=48144 RepID=A0AAV2S8P8_MEGNR
MDFAVDDTPTGCTQINESSLPVISPEVMDVIFVNYGVVYPIIIVLGVITNILCLIVLCRPRIRDLYVNKYLRFLAVVDLTGIAMCIPTTPLKLTCTFQSYSKALYYTYFGWMPITVVRNIGLCTVVWMSYDRFIAIWFPHRFTEMKKPSVIISKQIVTVILNIVISMPIYISSKIVCIYTENEVYWLSEAAYKFNRDDWLKSYTYFYCICIAVMQFTLLVFSIGLLLGIIKKKIINQSEENRNMQILQTVILLIMNSGYIASTFAYNFILLNKYNPEENQCVATASQESQMAWVNSIALFWSAFDISLYLLFIGDYRNVLKSVLLIKKQISTDNAGEINESSVLSNHPIK